MKDGHDYRRLAYIMVKDGMLKVIPVEVNLKRFTHITVHNHRLGRKLLLDKMKWCLVNGNETPVFILSEDEFSRTDQEK